MSKTAVSVVYYSVLPRSSLFSLHSILLPGDPPANFFCRCARRCSSAVTQPASFLHALRACHAIVWRSQPRVRYALGSGSAKLATPADLLTSRCCPSAVRQQASPSLLSYRRDREPASLLSTRPVLLSRPHLPERRTVSWLTAAGEQRGDKGGLLAGSRRQENNVGYKGGVFRGSRWQENNAWTKEACWQAHGGRRTAYGLSSQQITKVER